jgi:TrmH family RNA methyltransferase
MAIRIIQSKLNPSVKQLRGQLRYPDRVSSGLVGLEGVHLLQEALLSGVELQTIFVAQGHENLLSKPPFAVFRLADSVDVVTLPQEILDFAVSTETPQPIAALARVRKWRWPDLFSGEAPESPPLIVVLAGIQDPGNLGTILRSAEAFGATGAVSLPGTVSVWNAKAMRASAGSIFRLPLIGASTQYCFERLREAGVRILATMPAGAQTPDEVELSSPVALVIGSEGSGLAPELAAQCDGRITIPCPGPVESLNAAVAASVLLYEASRQRSNARRKP